MGSNEQNMMSLVSGIEKELFVFSIRGPLQQPPGYAFFTIQGFGNPHRDVFDSAVNKLEDFIEYAVENYPIDANEVYFMGFSQGAILSMTLGLKLGNRIKGIIALSGYIPTFVKEEYDIQPLDDVKAFISHGEYDQVLPFEWGVDAEAFYKQNGAASTFSNYPEGHTVSKENFNDFTAWFNNISNK
jgi:phospholipase/carboxylesterase